MANILLDTHVLIWFAEGNNRLSSNAITEITETSNNKFASIVSFWEIVIKSSLNKLGFESSTQEILEFCIANEIRIIQIDLKHLNTLQTLPHHHGDPFDRMIIAQALTEGLTIISADRHFDAYPVNVSW